MSHGLDALCSRSSPDAHRTTPSGRAPSIVVIGDLCLDLNEEGGRVLEASWGSPALFIASHLESACGLRALVSGPYGEDLRELVRDFWLDRGPAGLRSLSYRNVVEPTGHGHASAGATPPRVQCWRPSDRAPEPISGRLLRHPHDLVYFCPLIPDMDRADDIAAISSTQGVPNQVRVLLAQGLMRSSGPPGRHSYTPVQRRDIGDDEAATWSCFDIVVFSDDDHLTAVDKATRWSACSPDTGFVVTRGHLGATLCVNGRATQVSTRPLTEPATTVGAGDVFAAAVGIEFHRAQALAGMDRVAAMCRATVRATAAASAYVGLGRPLPRTSARRLPEASMRMAAT